MSPASARSTAASAVATSSTTRCRARTQDGAQSGAHDGMVVGEQQADRRVTTPPGPASRRGPAPAAPGDGGRECDRTAVPRPGCDSTVSMPAEVGGPGAHGAQPEAPAAGPVPERAGRRSGVEADAVVDDVEGHRGVHDGQGDIGAGGSRVLDARCRARPGRSAAARPRPGWASGGAGPTSWKDTWMPVRARGGVAQSLQSRRQGRRVRGRRGSGRGRSGGPRPGCPARRRGPARRGATPGPGRPRGRGPGTGGPRAAAAGCWTGPGRGCRGSRGPAALVRRVRPHGVARPPARCGCGRARR